MDMMNHHFAAVSVIFLLEYTSMRCHKLLWTADAVRWEYVTDSDGLFGPVVAPALDMCT